jgi:hypothetical protein
MLDIDCGAVPDAELADAPPETQPAALVIGLFHDVPGWIWKVFLGAWATFFALMFVFFATSATALFLDSSRRSPPNRVAAITPAKVRSKLTPAL